MNQGETESIEYKRSLSELREIVETVAAFATSAGGKVEIGVDPSGKRVGVELGSGTLEQLANSIKQNTDPPQYPSITFEGDECSAVIVIAVEASPIKPVMAYHRPIKRVGRSNQFLSREETHRLLENTTGRSWDSLPCRGLSLDGIDRQAVMDFLRRSGQETEIDTQNALTSLKMLTPDGLCNSAALLFARSPQQFIVEAQVKCARFLGSTSVEFQDERTLDGTVFHQLDETMAFVTRNTRQAIVITGRPERDIVPEYPAEAVREAIINAICHRDYAMVGTVQVRIYDDRLEVWNPGTLPSGMTVDQLYREHPSHPRNPNLAAALHRARVIEHWGTGTLRIVQACEARGMPRPEFIAEGFTFIVRFTKPPEEARIPLGISLNDRQKQALEYVREHGSISTAVYQEVTGVRKRQAVNDLNELVAAGMVARVGSGPQTRYALASEP